MSFFAIAWAFDHRGLTPPQRLTLMGLADYADDDNKAFPLIRTLAEKVELSDSAVSRAITDLVKMGLVERTEQFREDGSQINSSYEILIGAYPGRGSRLPGGRGGTGVGGGVLAERGGSALQAGGECLQSTPIKEPTNRTYHLTNQHEDETRSTRTTPVSPVVSGTPGTPPQSPSPRKIGATSTPELRDTAMAVLGTFYRCAGISLDAMVPNLRKREFDVALDLAKIGATPEEAQRFVEWQMGDPKNRGVATRMMSYAAKRPQFLARKDYGMAVAQAAQSNDGIQWDRELVL